MSGILGILRTDGAPVDRAELRRLTERLAFRGPDGQETWAEGPVGLGHAIFRTTREAGERQPASLEGEVWITADARIDGRVELLEKLLRLGRRASLDRPDAELILHAYHAWGEACVEHLIGDFAFAVWDGRQRRLFCARDQLGVKLLYYVHKGPWLLVGNTLEGLRAHPTVSDRLNERAIGDFLLFDYNRDPHTTTFADVQRLPPAHRMIWERGRLQVSRYWSLPIAERPVRFSHPKDYVERFRELLATAVADRLRTDSVVIWRICRHVFDARFNPSPTGLQQVNLVNYRARLVFLRQGDLLRHSGPYSLRMFHC
jgi:asparagine synthase (glutamine-hydrolysing)